MIERHVSFHVLPGRQAEFEALINQEYAPAMAKQEGFGGVALLRQSDAPTNYQMVIRFDSEETAAGWRASAEHKALSPRLKALHSGSELTVYAVVGSSALHG